MGRFSWLRGVQGGLGQRRLQARSRKLQRHARFERLEDRLALSCTAPVDPGVLPIEGDDAVTTIDMSILGDAATVECETGSPETALKGHGSNSDEVEIEAHGGDDGDDQNVSDEDDDEDAPPAPEEDEDDDELTDLRIDGGPGDDTISVNITGVPVV